MTTQHPPLITIDGPSGSGKSTLGRGLASRFRLAFIDTGLFYRGLMVAAAWKEFTEEDTEEIIELASTTVIELNTDPIKPEGSWDLRVDGRDPKGAERNPANARFLSVISSIAEVRHLLLEPQQLLARDGAVAVGRDCGTIVFPSADLKIYLDASDSTRRSRRAEQFEQQGLVVDHAVISEEVTGRDAIDAVRTYRADGAITLSTEGKYPAEVLEAATNYCLRSGIALPSGTNLGDPR